MIVVPGHDILVRKLKAHSALAAEDEAEIRNLPFSIREFGPDEDLARQGDTPKLSFMVVDGQLARYHTLYGGNRQYLSFNLAGDWPDLQMIFLSRLDHSVCALNEGVKVAAFQHEHLCAAMDRRPSLAHALWRETLIDAAIFRAAITNNSARNGPARMAHLFCEIFYRATRAQLVRNQTTLFPIRQAQLGETVGMALVTVNRTLRTLRHTGAVDLRDGRLRVSDWQRLSAIAEFDPGYLHERVA